MKDILGREVQENDLVFVLHSSSSGVNLELSLVTGFTKTLVRYVSMSAGHKKASHNMMKVSIEDANQFIENRFGEEKIQEFLDKYADHPNNIEWAEGRANWMRESKEKLNELIETHTDARE